jgi:hypothetical protein
MDHVLAAGRLIAIGAAILVGSALILFLGAQLLIYGPAWAQRLSGPPASAFPGSIGEIDGKGELSWWGCMKLQSGDVREVGNSMARSLFFMPGGSCQQAPVLQTDRLYLTWPIARPGEQAWPVQLVVEESCPESISPAAKTEIAGLLREYLDHPLDSVRYTAGVETALEAFDDIREPTRLAEQGANGYETPAFHGGVWGPARRPGMYKLCVVGD